MWRCLLAVIGASMCAILAPVQTAADDGSYVQNLDVIFIQWVQGTEPLALDPSFEGVQVLSDGEQESLRKALGNSGKLTVTAVCSVGDFPNNRRRMIVVLRVPISPGKQVPLQQLGPNDFDAIFIQGFYQRGWSAKPNTGTLEERLILRPDEKNPSLTLYTLELVGGGEKAGIAARWDKEGMSPAAGHTVP